MLKTFGAGRLLINLAAACVAALLTVTAAAGAQQGEVSIPCSNPASGATWLVKIDYDRGTVDSNPAKISDGSISWHDAKDGGNYTLDRKTGKLTVILASSTGGYFMFHQCKLQ